MSGFNDGFKGFYFISQVFDFVRLYEVFEVMVFMRDGIDYFDLYLVLFLLLLKEELMFKVFADFDI